MTLRSANCAGVLVAALSCLLVVAAFASEQEKTADDGQVTLLDLNTATVEQLDQLPGIGPSIAKAIVRFREKSGPFRRVEDLLAIRGITKKRLEKIRPHVVVKEPQESQEVPKSGRSRGPGVTRCVGRHTSGPVAVRLYST